MSGEIRTDASSGQARDVELHGGWCQGTAGTRWDAFCNDPRGRHFCLDKQVERDAPLDISSVSRPVQLTLDHPLDQLAMAAVPARMTLHFLVSPPLLYQGDRRDIMLMPSQEEFLGWHGLLPTVDVTCSIDAGSGDSTWCVAAPGDDAVASFVFECGAAPLARASLGSLEKAARQRREAFEQMIAELRANTDLASWNGVRRTVASNFWKDLPERIRQRVMDYFRGDARSAALVSDIDIATVLRDGSGASAALVALAGELLLAGLAYWQVRGVAAQIPDAFWESEMGRGVPFSARGQDFSAALAATLDAYARWVPVRQFYRDVLHDMDRSELGADPAYLRQRARLSRAMLRGAGQRVAKAGSVARDTLDSLDPAQARQRLAEAMQHLPTNLLATGVLEWIARLAQLLDRVTSPRPIELDEGNVLNEASMARDAIEGDHGTWLLACDLAPGLPATRIPALLVLPTALLPNGAVPLQVLSREDLDEHAVAGSGWRRVYRINLARRFDHNAQAWMGCDRELIVTGRSTAQRQALDQYVDTLLAEATASQQDYFKRHDRATLTIDGHADLSLPPWSRFAQRQVRFTGRGGRLVVPAQLAGQVLIDRSGLDADAAPPVLQIDPLLAASLQPGGTMVRGGRRFDTWHGPTCVLLARHADEAAHAQGLARQIEHEARRKLTEDLCDVRLAEVMVSTAIVGDIEIAPLGRALTLRARPGQQRFVVRRLGAVPVHLRVEPAGGSGGSSGNSGSFALALLPCHESVPRYTVSALTEAADGSLVGRVVDGVTGGVLSLAVAPGVRFDPASWEAARARAQALQEQAILDVQAWDAAMADGQFPGPGLWQEIARYGAQLGTPGDVRQLHHRQRQLQRKAAILHAHWSAERAGRLVAGPVMEPDTARRLALAREILAQTIVYLFRTMLLDLDDERWRQQLRDSAAHQVPGLLQRVAQIALASEWARRDGTRIYAALGAFCHSQAWQAGQGGDGPRAVADGSLVEAALQVIEGDAGSGRGEAGDGSALRYALQLILLQYLEHQLFDPQRTARAALAADLQRLQTGECPTRACPWLSAMLRQWGDGEGQAAAQAPGSVPVFVPEVLPDVLLLSDVGLSVPDDAHQASTNLPPDKPQGARSAQQQGEHSHSRSKSLLIFIGELARASPWWAWAAPGASRQRPGVTLDFRGVRGMGWLLQPASPAQALSAVAAAVPMAIHDGMLPVVGCPWVNYLIGAILRDIADGRHPEVSAPALVDEAGHWRQDIAACRLTDPAGNHYLLLGEAAMALRHWEEDGIAAGRIALDATLAAAGGLLPELGATGGRLVFLAEQQLCMVFATRALAGETVSGVGLRMALMRQHGRVDGPA